MSLTIRRAENKDTAKVLDLLHQVLEVHAGLRPDLFISGTTKYTDEELHAIFADETTPVYVAVNDNDEVLGYAFCILEEPVPSNNLHPRSPFMEQLPDVVARAGEFLERLKAEAVDRHILLSTHAIAMKGLLEYLTPESNGAYWSEYIGNCAVYVTEYHDGTYTVPTEWSK